MQGQLGSQKREKALPVCCSLFCRKLHVSHPSTGAISPPHTRIVAPRLLCLTVIVKLKWATHFLGWTYWQQTYDLVTVEVCLLPQWVTRDKKLWKEKKKKVLEFKFPLSLSGTPLIGICHFPILGETLVTFLITTQQWLPTKSQMLTAVYRAGMPCPCRILCLDGSRSLSTQTWLTSPCPLLLVVASYPPPSSRPWVRKEPLTSSGCTHQITVNSLERVLICILENTIAIHLPKGFNSHFPCRVIQWGSQTTWVI